jgi:hypothetical protein
MTSGELLDGKAGPEAQANEIFRVVSTMIDEAVLEVGGVYSADAGTVTHPGFPIVVVREAL